jgi:ribonuclease BN (tRNA processing enzyme)
MSIGDLEVRPFPLHHPNGATGYRIESSNAAIVYASDHEHGDAATDAILLEYSRDADILIYDAQYTPKEYEQRRGWGHSTWREAVRLAQEASVRQLILFHHDPLRTDRELDAIVREAQQEFPNTIAAREGWSTSL